MRITHHSWICTICRCINVAADRKCAGCGAEHYQRQAQVNASERSCVYYNPATGEHRTPARSDMPIPEVYAQQGFERREITSMIAWEKEAGVVHEASTFAPGNEPAPPDPRETVPITKECKDDLVRDMAEAFNSGPWTGGLPGL